MLVCSVEILLLVILTGSSVVKNSFTNISVNGTVYAHDFQRVHFENQKKLGRNAVHCSFNNTAKMQHKLILRKIR